MPGQLPENIENIVSVFAPWVPAIFIVVTLIVVALTIRKIQRSQMSIEDSVSWFIRAGIFLALLILMIIPKTNELMKQIADEFGFADNQSLHLIVLVITSFTMIKLATVNMKLSKTNERLNKTIQEFAAFKHEIEQENSLNKNTK